MKSALKLILVGGLFLAGSCSPNAYRSTNRSYKKQSRHYSKLLRAYPLNDSVSTAPYFVGTTNFSLRKPNFVVIHHTAQGGCDTTLRTFTLTRTQVSAHYVVCREGIVFHMLNDLMRAHHAGISRWGNNTDLNSSSIGIEVDNNGTEPYSEAQIKSLLELLGRLKRTHSIPQANFIGHADVAPGRKVDPSRLFPWKKLAESGYGYWYDTTNVQVPAEFNALQALRIIGYSMKDSSTAIQSYKIHFVPQDRSKTLNEADRKILYDLVKHYQ